MYLAFPRSHQIAQRRKCVMIDNILNTAKLSDQELFLKKTVFKICEVFKGREISRSCKPGEGKKMPPD